MRISLALFVSFLLVSLAAAEEPVRQYQNTLKILKNPPPLLADYPEFIEPVKEVVRYEAPLLVDDEGADLSVRAWRFSYNARGIIEMPNRLRLADTAGIVGPPPGIRDGQGWEKPEPAGVCDFCTPTKNALAGRHTKDVINPLLKSLRGKATFIMYSLIGDEDPIRKKLYRSISGTPTDQQRAEGARQLQAKLSQFK